MDLVFVIDSSNKVPDTVLLQTKLFIKNLLSNYKISKENAHISLVNYGDKPEILIKLEKGTDAKTVENVLNAILKLGGEKNMEEALKLVKTNVLTSEHGGRDGVHKHVVLFTFSPEERNEKIIDAAKRLKEISPDGASITVVGVGKHDKEYLSDIATSENDVVLVPATKLSKDASLNVLFGRKFVDIADNINENSMYFLEKPEVHFLFEI